MLDKTALTLTIIGALNWGSIGIFQFDIVAWLFGGQGCNAQPNRLYPSGSGGCLVYFAAVSGY